MEFLHRLDHPFSMVHLNVTRGYVRVLADVDLIDVLQPGAEEHCAL